MSKALPSGVLEPSDVGALAAQIGQHALLCYGFSLALLLALTTLLWRCLPRDECGRHCAAPPLRALALLAGAASFFVLLALQIGRDGALARFDAALAQTLAHSLPAAAAAFFARLTHAGDTLTLTLLTMAIAVLLLWHRQRALALLWVFAISGNGILNVSLKALFARARPIFDPALAQAAGWSFPSGHSSGTLVLCGMLAFLGQRLLAPQWRLPVVLLAVTLAWSVGVSRVLLRVHYFSDVLAGFCSGFAWLMFCLLVWHWLQRAPAAR